MTTSTAIQDARKGQAVAKTDAAALTMKDYIKRMEGEIKKALPSVITPERFTRIVLSALSTTPKLAACTPPSFLGAMMTAAQLGLEPNTPLGQAYLIPYFNGKSKALECQFQLGYKGLIELAYRSGEVSTIQAHIVYDNDQFEYALGLEPKLEHVPAKQDRGEPAYVYAVFRTKDSGYGFEVMSWADVMAHARKFSKAADNGPWKTNPEEMAKKTVLKRALKYAPLKTEFARSLAQDNTVHNDLSADMFSAPAVVIDETEAEIDAETGEIIDVTPQEIKKED